MYQWIQINCKLTDSYTHWIFVIHVKVVCKSTTLGLLSPNQTLYAFVNSIRPFSNQMLNEFFVKVFVIRVIFYWNFRTICVMIFMLENNVLRHVIWQLTVRSIAIDSWLFLFTAYSTRTARSTILYTVTLYRMSVNARHDVLSLSHSLEPLGMKIVPSFLCIHTHVSTQRYYTTYQYTHLHIVFEYDAIAFFCSTFLFFCVLENPKESGKTKSGKRK